MAIAGTTVWRCRTTGSDTNGGGFNSARGGTDYSQQDSPQATGTASSSGTTLTATTGIFTAAMVGNIVSNGSAWYEITAYTSSTVVTLDSAPTWTSQSIKVGGALATPGLMASLMTVDGMRGTLKAGTYTMTTATPGAGGPVVFPTAVNDIVIEGFNTTEGDFGTPPVIAVGTSGFNNVNIVKTQSDYNKCQTIRNVKVDGRSDASVTGVVGFYLSGSNSTHGNTYGCQAVRCASKGYYLGRSLISTVDGATTGFDSPTSAHGCAAKSCTTGFSVFTTSLSHCVAYLGTTGFSCDNAATLINCTAYKNTDGFYMLNHNNTCINCLSVSNTGIGFRKNDTARINTLVNCATYGNGTQMTSTGFYSIPSVTALSAAPFVNGDSGDFGLNSSSAAYSQLKAMGTPGTIPGLPSSVGYLDIGAIQHQDAGGGGILRNAGMNGGING